MNTSSDNLKINNNSGNESTMNNITKNQKTIKKVRFINDMNQSTKAINFEPIFLGYTEKQLVRSCHGNYNVKQLVKNYENLLAFNYALKERTKAARKPVKGIKEPRKGALSILKQKFDSSMPTVYEHKRVVGGKAKLDKKVSTVAAFTSTEAPAKPPEWPPERIDPSTIMTWNCNGVGPLLKNTDNLRELNDVLRSRSVDILVVQEAKLRAHESGNQELVSVKDQPLLDAAGVTVAFL